MASGWGNKEGQIAGIFCLCDDNKISQEGSTTALCRRLPSSQGETSFLRDCFQTLQVWKTVCWAYAVESGR